MEVSITRISFKSNSLTKLAYPSHPDAISNASKFKEIPPPENPP